MRIAVITCAKYKDAHAPFLALFAKFWPDCPYDLQMWSDEPGEPWCSVVMRCASAWSDQPILMLMEDFYLTAPVEISLVQHGLFQLCNEKAGCVRLYPCPGGIEEYGDPLYAIVPRGTTARVSCQAGIWNPEFLHDVARGAMSTTGEAGDFENLGTPYAEGLDAPVLAFKRELQPWPMQYLASAISRGEWDPNAIRLCAEHGIPMDRSQRSVAREAISRR